MGLALLLIDSLGRFDPRFADVAIAVIMCAGIFWLLVLPPRFELYIIWILCALFGLYLMYAVIYLLTL